MPTSLWPYCHGHDIWSSNNKKESMTPSTKIGVTMTDKKNRRSATTALQHGRSIQRENNNSADTAIESTRPALPLLQANDSQLATKVAKQQEQQVYHNHHTNNGLQHRLRMPIVATWVCTDTSTTTWFMKRAVSRRWMITGDQRRECWTTEMTTTWQNLQNNKEPKAEREATVETVETISHHSNNTGHSIYTTMCKDSRGIAGQMWCNMPHFYQRWWCSHLWLKCDNHGNSLSESTWGYRSWRIVLGILAILQDSDLPLY